MNTVIMIFKHLLNHWFSVDVGADGHTISNEFAGVPHTRGVKLVLHGFVTHRIHHIQVIKLTNNSSLGLKIFLCFLEVSYHKLPFFCHGGEVSLLFPLLGQVSHSTLILDPISFHLRA